jgi:hypothetical protein
MSRGGCKTQRLYLDECAIVNASEVVGVQHTSALGNRPYPFRMTR